MSTRTSLNPFSPEAVRDPYPVHEALREAGVAYIEEIDTWAVSRYRHVEAVLLDTERFSARHAAGGGGGRTLDREFAAIYAEGFPMERTLMTADPPEHRWYRTVLSKRFQSKSVHALEPFITEMVGASLTTSTRMATRT
jgi:cytochrome P450